MKKPSEIAITDELAALQSQVKTMQFPTKEAALAFLKKHNLQRCAFQPIKYSPKRRPEFWRLIAATRYYIVREWGLPHGKTAELLTYTKPVRADVVYKNAPFDHYVPLSDAIYWNSVRPQQYIGRSFGVFKHWRTAINLAHKLQERNPFKEYRVLNYRELIAYAKELGIDTDHKAAYHNPTSTNTEPVAENPDED